MLAMPSTVSGKGIAVRKSAHELLWYPIAMRVPIWVDEADYEAAPPLLASPTGQPVGWSEHVHTASQLGAAGHQLAPVVWDRYCEWANLHQMPPRFMSLVLFVNDLPAAYVVDGTNHYQRDLEAARRVVGPLYPGTLPPPAPHYATMTRLDFMRGQVGVVVGCMRRSDNLDPPPVGWRATPALPGVEWLPDTTSGAGNAGPYQAVGVAQLDGLPVAVVASIGGSVRRWRLLVSSVASLSTGAATGGRLSLRHLQQLRSLWPHLDGQLALIDHDDAGWPLARDVGGQLHPSVDLRITAAGLLEDWVQYDLPLPLLAHER